MPSRFFLASSAALITVLGAVPAAAQAQAGVLPQHLSVGGMFLAADWVVKAVMIGLVLASIITWAVLVGKHLELLRLRNTAEALHNTLSAASSLADLPADARSHMLVAEAHAEITQSAAALGDGEGLKERLVSRFDRFEAKQARQLTRGVTILATIGATAPFVGLFGTVWGIMNAFIGIAEMQTTNLAVVAPGIAEALLATALGLVAAIPAVVIYNHFARAIAAHRAVIADSSAALLRLVSRDLSRGTLAASRA